MLSLCAIEASLNLVIRGGIQSQKKNHGKHGVHGSWQEQVLVFSVCSAFSVVKIFISWSSMIARVSGRKSSLIQDG